LLISPGLPLWSLGFLSAVLSAVALAEEEALAKADGLWAAFSPRLIAFFGPTPRLLALGFLAAHPLRFGAFSPSGFLDPVSGFSSWTLDPVRCCGLPNV